jgi:hypothetical protein
MTGPYSTYSANMVLIAEAIFDVIDAAKATFTTPVEDVFYGDQDRIRTTPTICVEPSDKTRSLTGAPNMTENQFEVFILVYHNKVQDNQLTRKEVDQLAYEIEFLLHQDLQLGGLLIHGFVDRSESGYVYKSGTLYRTARMTFRGKNKTSLPVS